ncbi:zinc finger protein ZFAT-like [Watersipora subatra]|uniref:zinc finger protein ZFAT-like n=1 Tax=Watersipora subatra TaxID=2589382 RepID=UPI00355C1D97
MSLPAVAPDTFICGSCSTTFDNLVTFLEHKKSSSCGVTLPYDASIVEDNVTLLAEAPSTSEAGPGDVTLLSSLTSGGLEPIMLSNEMRPLQTNSTQGLPPVSRIVKKRGRPKKTLKEPSEVSEIIKPPEKTASMGTDGLLCCDGCKVKFKKERHFKSHKCKSVNSLYLKPEEIPELEGFDSRTRFPVENPLSPVPAKAADDSSVSDDDDTEDFNPKSAIRQLAEDAAEEASDALPADNMKPYRRRNIVGSNAKKKLASLSSKRKLASYPIPQSLDDIPDIPVFATEEDRKKFEAKEITIVDLSQTYDMYKTHFIEQMMNSNAITSVPRANGDISLHSCNVCEKVFKTLSHIRHHCLTHIDSKPFKCPECDFRANSKGNIYSHMRKHTGQMYRCRTCKFKSVNKSHLLEHEATHSGTVHSCALCHKHYSTIKSLINHVRIYHSKTKEGKAYHQKFVQVKEGPGSAMLFECHICDRRFKKENDRDRHLYVHNVRVEYPYVSCLLCKYETSKQSSLDSHYLKHRYAYSCTMCDSMYPSVQSLLTHINSSHSDGTSHHVISEECIAASLYLPEVKRTVIENLATPSQPSNENTSILSKLGFQPMTKKLFDDIRKTHGEQECAECGLLFKSEELLKGHTVHHEEENPFSCIYCDHRASSKNSLKLHINSRHEDKLFKCTQCDFVSKNRMALIDHKNRHETFKCPLCEQYLAGRRGLRNHLLSKHPEVDAESARKMSGYGRRTDAMKSGKAFKCPYCDKTFTNNNVELQKHIWIHEGIKPFKCELCEYSCRTRSGLTSHMLRHAEQKPFPCVFCGKRYKSKTALRWHERSHASGRLFKCDKCDYEGIQKSHLTRHLETHNLVKRFSCNHCYYSSNTVGYMRVHYTRCHPGITYSHTTESSSMSEIGIAGDSVPPNVYKCVTCDYLFGNLSDMKRHLRNKHRIHMTDINVVNNQEVVTQIVPLQNQDGITSDVQIIRIPLDSSMESDVQFTPAMQTAEGQDDSAFIDAGDLGDTEIQLMNSMEVDAEQESELQTVGIEYADHTSTIMTVPENGEVNSQICVQPLATETVTVRKSQGISLLKSSQTHLKPGMEETTQATDFHVPSNQ